MEKQSNMAEEKKVQRRYSAAKMAGAFLSGNFFGSSFGIAG